MKQMIGKFKKDIERPGGYTKKYKITRSKSFVTTEWKKQKRGKFKKDRCYKFSIPKAASTDHGCLNSFANLVMVWGMEVFKNGILPFLPDVNI